MERPTLAVCLIVKDEASLLPGALRSVAAVADQLVVVDTGSTDGTQSLARAAGAQVVPFAWCDDFAQARNAALPHVRCDWVLQLDADERLAQASVPALQAVLQSRPDFLCGLLPLHNAVALDSDEGEVLSGAARKGPPVALARLLRNVQGLAWESCIHEHLGGWLERTGFRVKQLDDVQLVHLGSVDSVRLGKDKLNRNARLLRKRCVQEPLDLVARGYLAHDLLRAGDDAGARRVADEGWSLLSVAGRQRSVRRLAAVRALVCARQHDWEAVLESTGQAMALQGPSQELLYLEGLTHEALAAGPTVDDRTASLRRALAAHRRARTLRREEAEEPVVEGSLALAWLHEALVCLQLGDAAGGLAALEGARHAGAPAQEVGLGLAEACLVADRPQEAMSALLPHLDGSPDGWVLAAAAA